MPAKTSKQFIPPENHVFVDPDDIEGTCKCNHGIASFTCQAGGPCKAAEGRCHLVVAAPGDPQLTKPKHDVDSDGNQTAQIERPPGWEVFCTCLKYTSKKPTDAEKAAWPKPTAWTAPAGLKLKGGNDKPCGMPVRANEGKGGWSCKGDDCYLVGLAKEGETQLVKLADPGGNLNKKDDDKYFAIFCLHLEKA